MDNIIIIISSTTAGTLIINMIGFIYGYGKLQQKMDDCIRRVTKIEERINL